MHGKLSLWWLGPSRGLDVRLPRTRVLLLGFLVLAATGWLPSPAHAEVEIDMLGDMVFMEAGGEHERGGSELEASMHSSLLQDFQEATEGMQAMDVVDVAAAQQKAATPTAFPDSSAVVGRIFQMKVPNKMEDVYLGDIVKVRTPPHRHRHNSRVLQGSWWWSVIEHLGHPCSSCSWRLCVNV